MMDFLATAYAEGSSTPLGSNTGAAITNVLFMVALFAIFYFLLIRPQQKQAKEQKEMINNLRKDDHVVTTGGLVGRIHRIEEEIVILEVGEVEVSNRVFKPVRIKIRRNMIGAVTSKAGITPPIDGTNEKTSSSGG